MIQRIGEYLTITDKTRKIDSENKEDKSYQVFACINNQEEDMSFLLTSLFYIEEKYPSFTRTQIKRYSDLKKRV